MEKTQEQIQKDLWRIQATASKSSMQFCVTIVSLVTPKQGSGSNPTTITIVRTDGRWTAMRG